MVGDGDIETTTSNWKERSGVFSPPAGEQRPDNPKERRRHHRLNRVFGAEFEHPDLPERLRLFVINISPTGLRATSNHRLMEDEPIEARLRWDSRTDPFEVKLRVVWQRELSLPGMFELGCEFLELPPAQWQRLLQLIERERRHKP